MIIKFLHFKKWKFLFLGIFFIIIILFFTSYFTFSNVKNFQKTIKKTSTTFQSGKEISRVDTNKKEVIFTFDGGSTTKSADKILEVLSKHHVKGTFFLTGKMIEDNPDFARNIIAQGNEIFNHTNSHPFLTVLSDEKIVEELEKMEQILLETTKVSSKPYFRAPYGIRNDRVLSVAEKAGYRSVYWTIDALDWKESEGQTAAQVKELILSNVFPGTIFLMHVGDTITGSILDDVFTEIERRGYKIVSLTEGIQI